MNKIKSLIPLHEIDEKAYSQIMNILNLDCLKKIAIMPDVHAGYDLCIGGVVLLDGHISPSFVGYDIGCGMTFINTNVKAKEVFTSERIQVSIFNEVYSKIPVGFSIRNDVKKAFEYEVFKSACGDKTLDAHVNDKLNKSVGTLGGGNHFIEYGENKDGYLCITIHSGSRNIGHSIASHYMKINRIMSLDSDIGQAYLSDMNFALKYALNNRLTMIKILINMIGIRFYQVKSSLINENHNHAVVTEDGVLHRKGATPANKGQLGIIPANMRDGVFITCGLGNKEFLSSASHGAGRVSSRAKAKKNIPLDLFKETMDNNGITAKVEYSTLDESPFAYKDIDYVLGYQNNIVINTIDHIKPIINIKG